MPVKSNGRAPQALPIKGCLWLPRLLKIPTGRVYAVDKDGLGEESVDLDVCRVYRLADPAIDGGNKYLNVYYTKDHRWISHSAMVLFGGSPKPLIEGFAEITPHQAARLIAEWTDGYLPSDLVAPMPSPSVNGRATLDLADRPELAAVRKNAGKLLAALRELGATGKESAAQKGILRRATRMSDREYRKAIKLLQAEKAVQTKSRVGTWLVT